MVESHSYGFSGMCTSHNNKYTLYGVGLQNDICTGNLVATNHTTSEKCKWTIHIQLVVVNHNKSSSCKSEYMAVATVQQVGTQAVEHYFTGIYFSALN